MRIFVGVVVLGVAVPIVVRWWVRRLPIDARDQISEAWREERIRERRD